MVVAAGKLKASILPRVIAATAISSVGMAFAFTPVASADQPPAQQWRHITVRPDAPAGAPNVLLILMDDVGFSASTTFGGAIPTPHLDEIAAQGLRYNRFHTTAMCSPTRAALLTGRNHHAVGYGAIANVALDETGYTSVIPDSAATIGRILRDNGYNTAWFGKNHNTPEWELGPLGPFNHRPNAWGFDYFYGFNAAMTDQVNPDLTENMNPIRRDPNDPDYFLDRDLADHMIHWLRIQQTLQPDRPFFAYLAPGTLHAPQQAPADWIARFKGKFDMGWDELRARTFARQKAMGIVPADAQLAPRPDSIPAWESLTGEQKRLYTRQMEVAAAQLAYLDHQFGRIVEQLKASGQFDNTLILFVQGDNGASLETFGGNVNEYMDFVGVPSTDADLAAKYDQMGGEYAGGQYQVGWAFATNTPFPWGKQIASHLGGIRDGLVVSWPDHIRAHGEIRSQFGHVTDIAPTIYEAAGITPPETVDGVAQQPIDGVSLVYSFDNARAPEQHREQYFEMLGNRAYYRDGWLASTVPAGPPWARKNVDPNALQWGLFDLNSDFSQTRDLSARYPDKLAELKAAFDAAAARNHVYPLSANLMGRLDRNLRPRAIPVRGTFQFYPGDTHYPNYAWPIIGAGWSVTAQIRTGTVADAGPIMSVGTKFNGYALKLADGRAVFVYDPTGRETERRTLTTPVPLPPGAHRVAVRLVQTGSNIAMTMLLDDVEVDHASIEQISRISSGPAFIGRPMQDDRSGPTRCDCAIDVVTIEQ